MEIWKGKGGGALFKDIQAHAHMHMREKESKTSPIYEYYVNVKGLGLCNVKNQIKW